MAKAVEFQSSNSRIEQGNLQGDLSGKAGMLAGFTGALGIIMVVTIIIVSNGYDLFTAPRLIASVIYGSEVTGFMPVLLGTVIHLFTGTLLGYVFARVMPRIYRIMWMVAGLIYGVIAWAVSTLVILPIIAPNVVETDAAFSVLLIAHIVYGFILGVAGSTYGMFWSLPGDEANA